MARMPGAVWRPIPASTTRMSSFDIVCIHTMVGSLTGTDSYFRKIAPGVNSHFGTSGDGEIWQWVDTAYRSGANLNGNHHIISIENADLGPGFPAWNTGDSSQVPGFTPAQIEANARICAWAHQTHGIPLELIPDAKPGRRGIGYHRQGVPGYMVAGAEKWSNATGKVCPGSRRIAQIPQIVARARELAGGAPIQEDVMNADQQLLLQRTKNAVDLLVAVAERPLEAEARLTARIAALQAVVEQLANRQGSPIDMAAVKAVVEKGVADAIEAIETTVRLTPESPA